MKKVNILMLGGIGVGKSSALASFYHKANDVVSDVDLSVTLGQSDAALLIEQLNLIKEPFQTKDRYFVSKNFREPTQIVPVYYTMEVGLTHEDPMLELCFTDISGELMTSKEGLSDIREILQDTRVIILAVDTVELMNEGQFPNAINPQLRRNLPANVHHFLQEWVRIRPDEPRMFCVVPLKTETWLCQRHDNDEENITTNAELIHRRIHEEFKIVFELLAKDMMHTAVVIAPIQTMGNAVFHKYVKNEKAAYPDVVYEKITGFNEELEEVSGYDPRDCDQPLKYVLNFYLLQALMARRDESQDSTGGIFGWAFGKLIRGVFDIFDVIIPGDYPLINGIKELFLDIFDEHRVLAKEICKFSSSIKTDMPFDIVQGEHLVHKNLDDFLK